MEERRKKVIEEAKGDESLKGDESDWKVMKVIEEAQIQQGMKLLQQMQLELRSERPKEMFIKEVCVTGYN